MRRAMPELSGFGKYVRFVHTENLIHNPDQQMSYLVRCRAQGMVVCLIGSGVGASIIANGAALRGSTASAGRVGEHHRHGGRPRLPVRGARVPGGLCRCRGNSRPVRRPAAR